VAVAVEAAVNRPWWMPLPAVSLSLVLQIVRLLGGKSCSIRENVGGRREGPLAQRLIFFIQKQQTTMAVELTNQEGGSSSSVIIPLLPIHQKQPSEASEPLIDNIPTSTKRQALQLLFGAGGIYASFLYYGSLQEDVFRYAAQDGTKFNHVWYLQVLESLANVAFGVIALTIIGLTRSDKSKGWWGGTPNLPKKPFLSTGLTQVCSKGFTSLALANGLSFPVATLAKSGKMAPVMMGSLILGGATYSLREYLQVLAIIAGTAILSMGKKVSWCQ
jgi:UDP-galactose transporter B1